MTATSPKKALGQHFLADRNILGVVERLARLEEADVVLEIGPGLGVLTTFLADRVGHVHAVELDRQLETPLRDAIGARSNVSLHFGDAVRLDLSVLQPTPAKLVANLPYNVATPIVLDSLEGLPSLRSWCVMVQREVAERFFAVPSTKAYGAVSVLVQLHTRRTGFHPVPRTVFRPPPNVESALVAFDRIQGPARAGDVRRVVEAAFGHRRKTLANAVELAGLCTRADAQAALEALGVRTDARAESLPPATFVALEQQLRGR